MFENARHERSLILLLSITATDILKQGRFSDHELKTLKNVALAILKKQRVLEQYFAVTLKE